MKVSKDLHTKLGMPPWEAPTEWIAAIKDVIARFVRGNTAAQIPSILLPSEQIENRKTADKISARWERESKASK